MSFFYGMLAVAGWVWLVVVVAFVLFKVRRSKDRAGFEVKVAPTDEKQH